jgi:hypothetical protein
LIVLVLGGIRHLIPGTPVELPAAGLRFRPSPLLEEECGTRCLRLSTYVPDPLRLDGSVPAARFPADDNPVDGVLDDIAQVLYRLPELIDSVPYGKTVFHLEGPKDVETARTKLGVVATTSGSTSSWKPEFCAHYTGADVVVILDNDAPGHKYADTVARDLLRVARSVKVVELPGLEEGGDLTDWLDAGHTSEEFLALVEESPAYGPEEEEPWPEPVPLEMKLPSVRALDALMVPESLREWVLDTSRRMDNAPRTSPPPRRSWSPVPLSVARSGYVPSATTTGP